MVKTAKSIKPKIKRVSQKMIEKRWPHLPKPSQVKTFQAQYAKTVSTWQHVEEGLYLVYQAITRSARPGAEAAAFYSVQSFRTKLNMIQGAIQLAIYDKTSLLGEWTTLSNRSQKKSERRNEIVHGMIWTEFSETKKDRKIYVGPISTDPRNKISKNPNSQSEPLTLKRLKGYENDFRNLAISLRQFSQRIPPP